MDTITINYNNLEDSINAAKKTRIALSDYGNEIEKKLINKTRELLADDAAGYVSVTESLALKKIRSLESKEESIKAYETKLNNILSVAQNKDARVSRKMERIAECYIGERSAFQKFNDFIYDL